MKKSELQKKLSQLGITYKKRDTLGILKEKYDLALSKICKAIEHHEKYKKSYFWASDNGNAQQRAYREKQLNFTINISNDTYYTSQVEISRKNFYYKGLFFINDKKVTLREWRKLLKII